MAANVAIARHLIKHSELVAKATGLPLFTCYSSEQKGQSFGVRLANAMESVFEFGFEQVIAIGNDCPGLTTELLQTTAEQLRETGLILGPATDGGVYLIGMSRDMYSRKQFVSLSWENEDLQLSWEQYQSSVTASIYWLSPLSDVDNARDFKRVLQTLAWHHPLRQKLKWLVSDSPTVWRQKTIHIIPQYFIDSPLRAPPF